jgi:hypothetical protein
MPKLVLKTDHCLNCSEPLNQQNFCPHCGQKNDGRRITFWQLVSESLSNFLAFDGRFLLTLKTLVFKPGIVPKHYKEGKRMRYMHPVRFYFLCSLVMLFFINQQKNENSIADIKLDNPTDTIQVATEAAKGFEFKKKDTANAPVEVKPKANYQDSSFTTSETTFSSDLSKTDFSSKLWGMRSYNEANPTIGDTLALQTLNLEPSFWNRFLFSQMQKSNTLSQQEYNRFFYKNFFWILFLFIPVLGLLLKLFFWRVKFFYPEHLFFAFYNQSILFLLFTLGFIFDVPDDWFIIFLLLYGLYLFIAVYRFYQQKFWRSVLKFTFLNLAVVTSFSAFILVSILITYLLY